MPLKSVEYICPSIILVIIFVLKLTVDENTSLENFKRLIVETSIDVMSLATSFVISYLIASANKLTVPEPENISWEAFSKGIIILVGYILALILTVFVSKIFTRKYSGTEKIRYLLLGVVIGYTISIACLYYSILLLRSLGGF